VSVEEEALRRLLAILHHRQIPYMLTGSFASSYHGRPRATHDTDVVIDPTPNQFDAFIAELASSGFYVNASGARAAFEERRQFNAIEIASASKVDLILRKDRTYSREEFARRQYVDLGLGGPVAVVTPEDAILSKLEWARRSGESQRQLRDAAGVLEVNPQINRGYVEQWARELGVLDLWRTISNTGNDSPRG
jgi:hypothetical protein